MRIGYKALLGVAAIGIATAASFPSEIGAFYRDAHPTEWTKRQALATCEQTSSTFIRFLPSDREECYSRLRNSAVGDRTGMWSKHDRSHKLALNSPAPAASRTR
jgi:hypothetical protein